MVPPLSALLTTGTLPLSTKGYQKNFPYYLPYYLRYVYDLRFKVFVDSHIILTPSICRNL